MQDEHGLLELDGIDSAVRAADVVFDHFQDAGPAESLHHLRRVVLVTALREVKGVTEELPYIGRKGHQVFFAPSDPDERFVLCCHTCIIPVME